MAQPTVPLLIDGQWSEPEVAQSGPVYNPSEGEVIARLPMCGAREVDLAVQAAKRAYSSWARTPPLKRAGVMFRYRELLEAHFEEISRLICRENGKTFEEATGSLRRGVEVVEFACGIGHLLKGENLSQVAEGIDGLTVREPVGVCAGITPFNFPAMVPMWMFPIAIACGNTFILKPSEKVPLTATRLGELLMEAGLPPGVFNIVHGGVETVNAICTHPGISAISFVGSSRAAQHVYSLGCQRGKRVQSGGGAKNVLLVMPDAAPDPTIDAIMGSAFGCAGQRCMAGSLLMGIGDAGGPLREGVVAAMDRIDVGDTFADPGAGMGPVIDPASQKRIFGAIEEAPGQGIEVVRDGRDQIPDRGFFVRPTLFDAVTPEHPVFCEELFGPVLSMMHPSSLDEAIEWINRIPYGNAATIFTRSGGAARQFAMEAECGMVGINLGVPAPVALFPFSGWDQSFFGDLHVQGTEGVMFYTRQKTVLTRW